MTLQVTRHGFKRGKQRIGIPKKAIERNAQKALEYGIDHRHAVGSLQRYLAVLYNRYHGNGNNIRIYNDFVYVFHDEILITVLNVPPEQRRAALAQQRRLRDGRTGETEARTSTVDGGTETGAAGTEREETRRT